LVRALGEPTGSLACIRHSGRKTIVTVTMPGLVTDCVFAAVRALLAATDFDSRHRGAGVGPARKRDIGDYLAVLADGFPG
jgi:hypothetical protein